MTDVQDTPVAHKYKVCQKCKEEKPVAEFRSSGYCKQCNKEYFHSYYILNRQKYLDRARKYHIDNIEKDRKNSIDWQKNNPDKFKANQKKYRKSHLEQRRIYNNEWRNKNKEKALIHVHNRRARKLGNGGCSYTVDDVKNILIFQKQKCAICRISIKSSYHIDHIIPLSKGGSNAKENIQLLCPSCNLSKSACDPIEFMQSIGMLL